MGRLLVSHVDLDGCGSLILERAYRDRLGFDAVMAFDYDFEQDQANAATVESFEEIVVVDLSVPEPYFLRLTQELGRKVRVLDHHQSSSYLDDYRGNIHDETRCGTRIFFEEYVVPRVGRLPDVAYSLVDLIDTYDLWKDTVPLWDDALSLSRVMYGFIDYDRTGMEKLDPFIRAETRKLLELSEWAWTPTERQTIERARENEDRRYREAARSIQIRVDGRGKVFGIIELPGKISIVCARILRSRDFSELDYVLVVNTYGSGVNGSISARSARGFDCTELGPLNGHPASAGATLEIEQASRLLESKVCLAYKTDEAWISGQVPLQDCV